MFASAKHESNQAMDWLVTRWQWPAACLFSGCTLLLMTPAWAHVAGTALALVMLQLPLYMVHQWEEHTGDRFRSYVNEHVGAGCEVLTPNAAFWINSLGVWGVDLAAIYLACFVDPALGLVACYLPLVNGLTHVREAVIRRRYNPGLATSVVLFLPVGGWSIYKISTLTGATWHDHALAAAVAVAIHAAIIAYIFHRLTRLRTAATIR